MIKIYVLKKLIKTDAKAGRFRATGRQQRITTIADVGLDPRHVRHCRVAVDSQLIQVRTSFLEIIRKCDEKPRTCVFSFLLTLMRDVILVRLENLKEPQVIGTKTFPGIVYALITAKMQVKIHFVEYLNII